MQRIGHEMMPDAPGLVDAAVTGDMDSLTALGQACVDGMREKNPGLADAMQRQFDEVVAMRRRVEGNG